MAKPRRTRMGNFVNVTCINHIGPLNHTVDSINAMMTIPNKYAGSINCLGRQLARFEANNVYISSEHLTLSNSFIASCKDLRLRSDSIQIVPVQFYDAPILRYTSRSKIYNLELPITYENKAKQLIVYFGQFQNLPQLVLNSSTMAHNTHLGMQVIDWILIACVPAYFIVRIILSIFYYKGLTFETWTNDTGQKDPAAFARVCGKRRRNILIGDCMVSSLLSVIIFFYLVYTVDAITIVDPESHRIIDSCPSGFYRVASECYAIGSANTLCGSQYQCYCGGVCYEATENSCTLRIPDVNPIQNNLCACNGDSLYCVTPCGFSLLFGNNTRYNITLNSGISATATQVYYVRLGSISIKTRDRCRGGSGAAGDVCNHNAWTQIARLNYHKCSGAACNSPYHGHSCGSGHKMCEAVLYAIDYVSQAVIINSVIDYHQEPTIEMDPFDQQLVDKIHIVTNLQTNLQSFPNGLLILNDNTYLPLTTSGMLQTNRAFVVYPQEPAYDAISKLIQVGLKGNDLYSKYPQAYSDLLDRLVAFRPIWPTNDQYLPDGEFNASLDAIIPSQVGITCTLVSNIVGIEACSWNDPTSNYSTGLFWIRWDNTQQPIVNIMPESQFVSPVSNTPYSPGQWNVLDSRDLHYLTATVQKDKPLPTATPHPDPPCHKGMCVPVLTNSRCHYILNFDRYLPNPIIDVNSTQGVCADDYIPPVIPDVDPGGDVQPSESFWQKILRWLKLPQTYILYGILAVALTICATFLIRGLFKSKSA